MEPAVRGRRASCRPLVRQFDPERSHLPARPVTQFVVSHSRKEQLVSRRKIIIIGLAVVIAVVLVGVLVDPALAQQSQTTPGPGGGSDIGANLGKMLQGWARWL